MAKKNKKEKRQRKGKEVIDLTSYISPEMWTAATPACLGKLIMRIFPQSRYRMRTICKVQKSALQALQCAFLFVLISS